ncbi:hypothetical protein JOE25_000617 [Serratia sp. PL17]|nr:hypothetical protein [Serratia sp. PL17]
MTRTISRDISYSWVLNDVQTQLFNHSSNHLNRARYHDRL